MNAAAWLELAKTAAQKLGGGDVLSQIDLLGFGRVAAEAALSTFDRSPRRLPLWPMSDDMTVVMVIATASDDDDSSLAACGTRDAMTFLSTLVHRVPGVHPPLYFTVTTAFLEEHAQTVTPLVL